MFVPLLALICGCAADQGDGSVTAAQVLEDGDLTTQVVLGSADDSPLFMLHSHYAASPNGTVWVTPTHEPGSLSLFDSTGAFVTRIGRLGEGPGELERGVESVLVSVTGEIYAADIGQRVTVFDSKGAFLRSFSFPLPGPIATLKLDGSRQNIMAQVGFGLDPDNPNPIIVVNRTGALQYQVKTNGARTLYHAAPDGSIWLAPLASNSITQVSKEGTTLRSLTLPTSPAVRGLVTGEPRIADLRVDSDGTLLVLAFFDRLIADTVPPAASERGEGVEVPVVTETSRSRLESPKYWHGRWLHVLYAFGPQTDVPKINRAYPNLYLHEFAGERSIVALEEDEMGRITAHINRITVAH